MPSVKAAFSSCIYNFSGVRQSHIIEEKSPLYFDVTFARKKVVFQVDYEIYVTVASQTKTLDTFISELNVELANIVDLADKVMIEENKQEKLENVTVELMAINPDIPLNGLEIDCSTQTWNLNDIKSELQQTLKFNLPTIRFKNTKFPPFINPIKDFI